MENELKFITALEMIGDRIDNLASLMAVMNMKLDLLDYNLNHSSLDVKPSNSVDTLTEPSPDNGTKPENTTHTKDYGHKDLIDKDYDEVCFRCGKKEGEHYSGYCSIKKGSNERFVKPQNNYLKEKSEDAR